MFLHTSNLAYKFAVAGEKNVALPPKMINQYLFFLAGPSPGHLALTGLSLDILYIQLAQGMQRVETDVFQHTIMAVLTRLPQL